jgi:hypothetical protein
MWERNQIKCENITNADGNPTGGTVSGPGLSIEWQNGRSAGSPEA